LNPNKVSNHYACIVVGGKILSTGFSSLAGCSRYCKTCVTRHAEVDVISKVKDKKRLKKAVLYSIRYAYECDGTPYIANGKPCLSCKKIAESFGIKSVVYSNKDGVLVKESLNDLDCKHTTGTIIRMNRENSNQIQFQRSKTRKK